MRWEAAGTALMVLLAATLAVASPSPPPGPFQPHAPIAITGDAGFTAANGVVAGTGAPNDPYVIAGWSISASGSVGISITNVTKAFAIRNNSIAARVDVQLFAMAVVGVVQDNQLTTMGTAVSVQNADALVLDNSIGGDLSLGSSNVGVSLVNSNSLVQGNAFVYAPFAIQASHGSPTIRCNDIHDDSVLAGISVTATTNATIDCNTLTSCQTAIVSLNAIGTVIVNNTMSECKVGLQVTLTKDAIVVNNTVRDSFGTQVAFSHVSGNFSSNVIVDGQANAVIMDQSPMIVSNNTIEDNLGVGLWLQNTAADVSANLVAHNAIGIKLDTGSVPWLTANVLVNDTVGIDLPYASRQAILHMQGNFVNGVNVDGTVLAQDQVFFYQAANVQISGGVRDSGFSAGYFGSLTAQGNVVLYEVDNAEVDATLLAHANVGVTAINSFNVVLRGDVITDTIVGVEAQAVVTGQQVPACAISVKNTTINVTVDPIGTIGVDAHACLANVVGANVSVVQTGIKLDGASSGTLSGNVIASTNVGIDLGGTAVASIDNNTVTRSAIGMRLAGVTTTVADNTLALDGQGIQLSSGSRLQLLRNVLVANGDGVIDLGVCNGAISPCGSVDAQANLVASNARNGISVNGTSTLRGDVLAGNGRAGAALMSATLVNVTASGNGGDGVSLAGDFAIFGSTFTGNAGNGASVAGQGSIRLSSFTGNLNAGLFARSGYVNVLDSNFSRNLDGIGFPEGVSTGGPLPAVSTATLLRDLPAAMGPDPMDVHRSVFLANERDAVRAGALLVNATSDYWGGNAPAIDVGDTVGAFQNGVSPLVRFVPYYTDAAMTTTGPVPGL
jgi:parallel beta-helix repeat protein